MMFIGSKKSSFAPASSKGALNQPQIEKIVASPTNSKIVAGSSLIIYGKNFSEDITLLRLNGGENLLEPQIVEDNRILFQLPHNLYAGVQKVQVVHQQLYKYQNYKDLEVVSNEQTFILHPTINDSAVMALQD